MRMFRALCAVADGSHCWLLLPRLCDGLLKFPHLHIAVLQPVPSAHPGCQNHCDTQPSATFLTRRSAIA